MVSECVKWSSAFPAVLGDVVAPEGKGIKIGFSVLVAGKSGIQGTQPRRRKVPNQKPAYKHTTMILWRVPHTQIVNAS